MGGGNCGSGTFSLFRLGAVTVTAGTALPLTHERVCLVSASLCQHKYQGVWMYVENQNKAKISQHEAAVLDRKLFSQREAEAWNADAKKRQQQQQEQQPPGSSSSSS